MSEGNLINAVCDRIKFDKESLEKNELGRIEVESFNLSEFWTQFGAAVQSLNNEVTKVGFSCGKKPFPSVGEINSMMQDLLQYYTIMRDLYLVLPPDVGTVLYKAVTSAVIAIIASLLDFVKSLHNLTEKGAKERLTLTGAFWDACNAVDALPKDNLQATLKVMESEVALASDAQQELETVSTCTAIDEVNINIKVNKKTSRKFHKSELRIVSPELESEMILKTSTERYYELKEPNISSKDNEDVREIKAIKHTLGGNGDNDLNPDDIHNESNKLRSVEDTDSDRSPQTHDSLLSNFIILDEVLEDAFESIHNSDSVAVAHSPYNDNKVVLENKELKIIESEKRLISEEIASGTKSKKLKSSSSTTLALLSSNEVETSVVPQYRKDVFLNYEVPDKRLNGAQKRRRRKYLEEVSKDLAKAFESDSFMKNMEAMVLYVPKSFIENCDTFNVTKVIDSVRKHNSTLDTREWLLYTHWVGEGRQLYVLLLVDKASLQSISDLDSQIYLSKDLKTGIRKFIPKAGKQLMTTVDSGNRTATPELKITTNTVDTSPSSTSMNIPKHVNLMGESHPFSSVIPSTLLISGSPYSQKRTFVPDTHRSLHQHEDNNCEKPNRREHSGHPTRSNFSRQNYSLEPPSKMRLSEKFEDYFRKM